MKVTFCTLLLVMSLMAYRQQPTLPSSNLSNSSTHEPSTPSHTPQHSNNSQLPYALGTITQQQLFDAYPTFANAYNKHQVTAEDRSALQQLTQASELVIVFGSWCHDSQREVPRLLKLLDSANNSTIKVTLVAVGYNKQIPDDANPHQLAIKYTPTIFVLDKKGNELGRFIERPNSNWATDISELLSQ